MSHKPNLCGLSSPSPNATSPVSEAVRRWQLNKDC
jgi:hypothetical protein